MHSHSILILCFLLLFSRLAMGQNMHVVVDQIKCNNDKSGSISVTVDSTFQEAFTVTISDTSGKTRCQFFKKNEQPWKLNKLEAGKYFVSLQTKNNNSMEKLLVEIRNPAELKTNIITIDSDSEGANPVYSLKANPTGGTPPYIYCWSDNTGKQTTQTAKNLTQGTYTCNISDYNGCGPKVATFFLYDPEIQKFKQLKNKNKPQE